MQPGHGEELVGSHVHSRARRTATKCSAGVVGKRGTGSNLPFCRSTLTTGRSMDEGGAVTRLALDTVRIIQARWLMLVKAEKHVNSRNAKESISVGEGC